MGVMSGDSVGEVEGAPPPSWHAPAHAPTAASAPRPVPAQMPVDALAAVVARGAEADEQERRQHTSELPKEWFRVRRAVATEPVPAEEGGPDLLSALGRVRWECAALAMCALGPQFVGLLAVLIGGVMVSRSRFWEIGDKVRALLGIPVAGLTLAVFWAWLRATELQQADASKARLEIAGHSLAHSLYLAPQLVGLGIALLLGHRLVRDARWS
jgi:hypothetical protein